MNQEGMGGRVQETAADFPLSCTRLNKSPYTTSSNSEVPLIIDFLPRVLTHTTVIMLVVSPALTRYIPNMDYLLVIRISP